MYLINCKVCWTHGDIKLYTSTFTYKHIYIYIYISATQNVGLRFWIAQLVAMVFIHFHQYLILYTPSLTFANICLRCLRIVTESMMISTTPAVTMMPMAAAAINSLSSDSVTFFWTNCSAFITGKRSNVTCWLLES